MSQRVRILSDLHFGHAAAYVRQLDQIAPLMEGVPRVIFNGDSVEMRFLEERAEAEQKAGVLRHWCVAQGVAPLFITGNHDPFLTDTHYVELAGGTVLVTHGDILFHGISPWSRESGALSDAHSRELAAQESADELEGKLRAAKDAMRAVEHLGPKMLHGRHGDPGFSSFLHEIWPPWRPLRIIGCWLQAPGRAAEIVTRCRPGVRFAIVGHMHWAGVWRTRDCVVVNTGSFLPFSRRYAVDVDVDAGELVVRKIVSRKKVFHLGPVIAQFELPKA